ncbi:DUF3592 domain-containing protein [Amycolatopsis rhabdoformis]|uniref:DUF3592 domain-containing protein n=1 Tax=Amycolatopsis rhabdoformis TaxID=1448059 RepID=A0ABZ1I894_9PSEU|nr:DUF3592 domain-containing protein [Amycolatopsis rhabdoformis]WSE30644.1 DUF3592 domain-containing protein [Amycolatopsis rhabdoformis]
MNRARARLGADEQAWNRVLRKRSWRSVTATVLWLLVLASAVLGMITADASADTLLVSGMRAVGRVAEVTDPRRGTPTMTVDYQVGVTPRRAVVNRDSGVAYQVGDLVWVYYDPIDPQRVRTAEERNHSDALKWGLICPALVALVFGPWSAPLPDPRPPDVNSGKRPEVRQELPSQPRNPGSTLAR